MSVPVCAATPAADIQKQGRRNVNFSNRPLPLTPVVENVENARMSNSFRRNEQNHCHQRKSIEEGQRMQKKELVRRKTVPNFPTRKPFYGQILNDLAFVDCVEDHIYEQIDDVDDGGKDAEENSFLTLISSERRKNLKFYGCTDWDFGTEI